MQGEETSNLPHLVDRKRQLPGKNRIGKLGRGKEDKGSDGRWLKNCTTWINFES